MSETHTAPHSPEAKAGPALPPELQLLASNLNTINVTGLDKLHLAYQDKLASNWKAIFNKAYNEEKARGLRSGEARRLAERKANMAATNKTYKALEGSVQDTVDLFMPPYDPSDPNFDDAAYAEQYDDVHGAVMHVAEMDPTEWEGDRDDDDVLVGNGVVHDLLKYDDAEEQLRQIESLEAELEVDREKLKKLEEALASLTAKRMGRLRSTKGTQVEFDDLQQKYHEKLIEVEKKEEALRELNNPARTDEQKRLDVMTHLLSNEKELRELTNNKLEDTKLDKISQWLNRGSKWQKAGKGILLAAVPAGAGIVIAATFTGVGLVAAGTGLAASITVGGKLMINFARRSTDRRIKVNEVDVGASRAALDRVDSAGTKSHEEIQREAINERGQELRGDIKEQQKRRRRTLGEAAIVTAATIVVSTGVSAGVQSMFENVDRDILSSFKEKHYGKDGVTSNGSGHVYNDPANAGGGAGGGGSAGSGLEAQLRPDNDPGVGPKEPEVQAPKASEYSLEAQKIHAGEGLFSIFEQMNIPKSDYHELLQKAGPKLAQLDNGSGQPFAYEMNGQSGNWGLRMTADGKMPEGALDIISETHQEMAGSTNATPIEKIDVIAPNEVANNPTLQELAEISDGMGGREYAQSLGFNPDAWNRIQHDILQAHPNQFYLMGENVGLRAGEMPPEVAADVFNRLESVDLPSGNSIILLDTIQPSDINSSVLDRLSVLPADVGSVEEFMRDHGLGHAWLEVNNPALMSELANAAPDAFRVENGTLELIPKGRINDEAWVILANHMNAIERARMGIA